MPAQALAAIATLLTFAVNGNRVELRLDRGSAELVWLNPASFHFRRTLEGPLAPAPPERATEAVAFQVDDTPAALHLRSKSLDVAILKSGLLVQVKDLTGAPLMVDLTEPRTLGTLVTWDRSAPPGVRLYGLGKMDGTELDLRGKIVHSQRPLLISSAGYGEQHPSLADFDFTRPDRYTIQAPQVDYYFLYGPKPKEIFQQIPLEPAPAPLGGLRQPASWQALRSAVLDTVHEAMSGPVLTPFSFARIEQAPDELRTRIRQVAALVPGSFELSPFRRQLASFFDIYAIDTRDRHYPVWHALPFQFPEDPECAHHADEFMLGDELLIAPVLESGTKRPVYLPPGGWTMLETNREYTGRQTIPVDTPALPVFARNGAIVPLDSDNGIGLHYFPKAGGEFFLLEKEIGQYTQIHAAPALDIIRLEIESKKERVYQWVVHHVERPVEVGFDGQKWPSVESLAALADRTWLYDAAGKNLLLKVRVKAGEDSIVNLSW